MKSLANSDISLLFVRFLLWLWLCEKVLVGSFLHTGLDFVEILAKSSSRLFLIVTGCFVRQELRLRVMWNVPCIN